jgi:hypothetical protein
MRVNNDRAGESATIPRFADGNGTDSGGRFVSLANADRKATRRFGRRDTSSIESERSNLRSMRMRELDSALTPTLLALDVSFFFSFFYLQSHGVFAQQTLCRDDRGAVSRPDFSRATALP